VIWTLPNILTVARIALAPVIALLPFIEGYVPKLVAFVVFLAAAISDIYDGRLARERGEITDLGKLLDPLADKLLLVATLIPIYWITRYPMRQYEIPWWGNLPMWVAVLLIGREIAMTVFRQVAKRRGVVIAAAGAGKLKTIVQAVLIGATILWFARQDPEPRYGWQSGWGSRRGCGRHARWSRAADGILPRPVHLPLSQALQRRPRRPRRPRRWTLRSSRSVRSSSSDSPSTPTLPKSPVPSRR